MNRPEFEELTDRLAAITNTLLSSNGELRRANRELQAALREVVTDMESWTKSEYSGTDELEPRLAKLQAYHRLFQEEP